MSRMSTKYVSEEEYTRALYLYINALVYIYIDLKIDIHILNIDRGLYI